MVTSMPFIILADPDTPYQPSIKQASRTISQLIAGKVAKLGENISVLRFARFKVGNPDLAVVQTKTASEEPQAYPTTWGTASAVPQELR